jgi:hypothetical protein
VNLIADMEDAEGAFVGAKPSGLVRVDVHGTQARYFLLPGLPRFRQQYPDIRLYFSEAHQPLDTILEGLDCILRAGGLSDSPLIKRRLALLDRGTFASPDYLSRFDMPRTPDDLAGHEMVGLLSPDSGEVVSLVFGAGGKARRVTRRTPRYAIDAHTLPVGGPSRRSDIVLRFCTIAARWNSSRALLRPRRRIRSKPCGTFRCAKRISTFLRAFARSLELRRALLRTGTVACIFVDVTSDLLERRARASLLERASTAVLRL